MNYYNNQHINFKVSLLRPKKRKADRQRKYHWLVPNLEHKAIAYPDRGSPMPPDKPQLLGLQHLATAAKIVENTEQNENLCTDIDIMSRENRRAKLSYLEIQEDVNYCLTQKQRDSMMHCITKMIGIVNDAKIIKQ